MRKERKTPEIFLVGDIFSLDYVPSKVTSRTWHINPTDCSAFSGLILRQPHKICFRHGQVSGNWVLILDGKVEMHGENSITHRTFTIRFVVEGLTATIIASGSSRLVYTHTLEISSVEIIELKQKATPEMISSGGLKLWEKLPVRVSIPDYRSYHEGEKLVTVYQIFTQSGGSLGEYSIVERRFSEFVVLKKLIQVQTDPSVCASLPNLPEKLVNPWVDQTNESFIDTRRAHLEDYLCNLLKHPLVSIFVVGQNVLNYGTVPGH